MKTEQVLRTAFEFQRFQRNPRLQRLIDRAQAEFDHPRELSEEETEIWAAGDTERQFHDPLLKHED